MLLPGHIADTKVTANGTRLRDREGWMPIDQAPVGIREKRVDLWIVNPAVSGKAGSGYRVPDCFWDARAGRWRSPWSRQGADPIPAGYVPTHFRHSERGPEAF